MNKSVFIIFLLFFINIKKKYRLVRWWLEFKKSALFLFWNSVSRPMYEVIIFKTNSSFDVFFPEKCTADRCSKVPCSHGGKCLTTGGDTAVCLCPLGYTGDLCETRVDLQVRIRFKKIFWPKIHIFYKLFQWPTKLFGLIADDSLPR